MSKVYILQHQMPQGPMFITAVFDSMEKADELVKSLYPDAEMESIDSVASWVIDKEFGHHFTLLPYTVQ